MLTVSRTDIVARIKRIVIESAELDIAPDSLTEETLIFPSEAGDSLELDSLIALEVFFAIGDVFAIPDLAEADRSTFQSIGSLADFVISMQA